MRCRTLVPFATFLLLAAAGSGSAQRLSAGGQTVWGADTDSGLGGRVIADLGFLLDGLETAASFDWFFPGADLGVDVTYWEANVNVVYRIGTDSDVVPYAGAGLNYFRFDVSTNILGTEISGDEAEAGVNLLGGFLFRLRGVRPFLEGRLELGGGEQFVAAAGIRL